jgi:ribosome-binding ATPase
VLELELVLADLEAVEAALTRARKVTRVNAAAAGSTDAMEAAQRVLSEGLPLYRAGLDRAIRDGLAPLFLLTNKPFFCVVNLDEDDLGGGQLEAVAAALGEGAIVLGLSVRLESEAALLDTDEQSELLEGLGLGEGALTRVARALFDAVGRRTFFTTGEDESRAWTFRAGARAPVCAGAIPSDLQRGFIRAEVIWWEDLIALGSWAAAKAAGKLRVEGKDYEVADGDVLEIRFNV